MKEIYNKNIYIVITKKRYFFIFNITNKMEEVRYGSIVNSN